MSSLLYYSISSNLTEDEIIEVDRRIAKDREAVYLFFRELPSNSKRKAKRLFVDVIFTFQLGQPLIPFTTAVMMPLPPAIERLSPFEQDRILGNKNYYPQIATIIEQKIDKMVLTDEQIDDLNRICYKLQTGSITLDKAILEIRGGSLIDTAAALVLIIVMLKTMRVGIDGFQIPIVPQNGGVHRPANGGIQQQINHPKHGGRITLKMSESNQCPAHQTQT